MLRYFAIATVLVLAVAVIATMHANSSFMRLRFAASTHAPAPQHLPLKFGEGGATPDAVSGDAPWALSALPDCFAQRAETTGRVAFVRAHIPANAEPVPSGTTLTYGPCTIIVREDQLLIDRGSDRMRVPPRATLYRRGGQLVLLRTTGSSAVLRTYDVLSANHT